VAENSNIEWTDHTISFWWGCEKVSAACANCYADTLAKRYGDDIWGKGKPRRKIKSAVGNLLKLNEKAKAAGRVDKVFINSMSDFFESDRGQLIIDHQGNALDTTLADMRREAFEVFDQCSNLALLLLTKRPENIRKFWSDSVPYGYSAPAEDGWLPCRTNVWLGTTVENQEQAEKRIPELLKCRDLSPCLFLSCEPLLGSVDLEFIDSGGIVNCLLGSYEEYGYICDQLTVTDIKRDGPSIDWVIAGGESGQNARPSHIDWYRSLRYQCKDADVPFFMKQWGEWAPGVNFDPETIHDMRIDLKGRNVTHSPDLHDESDAFMDRVGKKKAGRLLDGVEHNGMPEVKLEG